MNIILIGLAKEIPERDKKYELHRLLSTLLSEKLKVTEKIEIVENEYHIPVKDELKEVVNIMCNLGEGIEERAIERTTKKVTKEVTQELTKQFILSMYENQLTLEQIAKVTHKSVEEVRAIIDKEAALV